MAAMPNPPGMHRVPVPPGGRPPFRYAILDGEQVIGHTERRAESDVRYWLAIPFGETVPCWFPRNRHQQGAMAWLRRVS
jgi:hypothetical protein